MKYKREEEKIRIRGCILANERASIRMKEEQFSSELYRNFFSRKHRDGGGGNSTFDLWEHRGCGCNLCSGTSLRLLYRRLTQRANDGLLLQERSMPVYSMNRRREGYARWKIH